MLGYSELMSGSQRRRPWLKCTTRGMGFLETTGLWCLVRLGVQGKASWRRQCLGCCPKCTEPASKDERTEQVGGGGQRSAGT